MIPYFEYHVIAIGPIHLQVWGIFVSLGLLAGFFLADKLAKKYVLAQNVMIDIGIWALAGGLIMARIFHIFFYEPIYYLSDPVKMLMFWQGGFSSLGGFVGAFLAIWVFAKKRNFSFDDILPYFDIGAISLWLGWAIGRLGCFFIHDHPGRLTDFFMAVDFPAGARHDLGLYDSLLAIVLFASYFLLFKRLSKFHHGLVVIFSFMDYAIFRFLLDFLRADQTFYGGDARYLNLTPAQWGMASLFLALTTLIVWFMIRHHKKVLL
ncbi:MAG: prolipoprotein diacylglyceryl transferase family protein [bacterium]